MFHEKMYKLIFLWLILLESVNLSDVSYYEVLGVHKKASILEIRQAYKKLAVKYHPDKTTDDVDQDKFILITEAYETLKDSEKRRQYDLYGSFDSYTKKYSYRTQSEYDNLFHNGLYHDDSNIDSLSGRTFNGYLSEGFHFINFYSPFCPPCQKLVDHWKRLAELYKGIVKVGAVNCKYHNSFCYNSMRIGSYPSLLFYPNGKDSSYVFYHGERTLESLNEFIMAYLSNRVNVPTVAVIRSKEKPMAYVMGTNRIDRSALTRIAFHLKGIVNMVIVIDENVREQLTKNDLTSVVFIFNEITKEIETTEEKEVLKEIVEVLPKIDLIGPDELKDIRNELRSSAKAPWVLYFTTNNDDKLLLYQMRVAFPEMYFGIVDCNQWGELCASLQVERGPAFGVMKVGGAYQRARPTEDVKAFIETAAEATNLHTLSASDLSRILDGEVGMWVIVVVPHQVSWEEVAEPFTQTSLQFKDNEDISFGIMACTSTSDKHCRRLTNDEPKVVIQNAGKRHHYDGKMDRYHLSEFIRLLINNNDLELTEQQVLEIMDASSRTHSWLVAFFPAHCGRVCHHDLWHEWRLVANKLRPLEFVRVGVLECADGAEGICNNVRAATARMYPLASGQHYTVSLQHLSQAPYILEWALGHIDAVQTLDWPTFMHDVAAEELKPSGAKKPWLIYFHSPRCYRCYEMYADFAIAGIIMQKAVNVGKVNCEAQRALCQHEVVGAYPALRLYLHRNQRQAFSSVISVQADDYATLLQEITPHLKKYDENVLDTIEDLGVRSQGIHMKHDEF